MLRQTNLSRRHPTDTGEVPTFCYGQRYLSLGFGFTAEEFACASL